MVTPLSALSHKTDPDTPPGFICAFATKTVSIHNNDSKNAFFIIDCING